MEAIRHIKVPNLKCLKVSNRVVLTKDIASQFLSKSPSCEIFQATPIPNGYTYYSNQSIQYCQV